MGERLTFKSVEVRAVAVPLKRPVIAKVGSFTEWPVLLIDLFTQEGIVGRSYLGPYLKNAARYIIPAIRDLASALAGKPVAPMENFQLNRRSLSSAMRALH
jgi:mandelate racemase